MKQICKILWCPSFRVYRDISSGHNYENYDCWLIGHLRCICMVDGWLVIYCFTSRSRIFHLYGDITITGEGHQNVGLCSALRAFGQGGIYIVPRDLGFPGHIWRTAPFSRLLRHAWGCGGPILTRILTGWMYGWRTRLVLCYYPVTVLNKFYLIWI
jgi:hypothetical protein